MSKEPKRLFQTESAQKVAEIIAEKQPKRLSGLFPSDGYVPPVTEKTLSLKMRMGPNLGRETPVTPVKEIVKSNKPLFENGEKPATQTSFQYIKDNYAQVSIDHEQQIKRQLKQLFPLSIESTINWGAGVIESIAEETLTISHLSNNISSLNGNELIEEILDRLQPSFFNKIFAGSTKVNIDTSKKNLYELKNKLMSFLNFHEKSKSYLSDIEIRLLINQLVLISVRETTLITDDNIKSILLNRSNLLQSSMQQLQFNKTKLQQLEQMILNQIQKIDHIVNVTLVAIEAVK